MAPKAATEPAVATMTPPIAGPKLRAMLKLMLFNVIADGSIFGGTCSFTDDCQAGPNSAMPLPMAKREDQQVDRRQRVKPGNHRQADGRHKRQRKRDEADEAAVVHVGDRARRDRDEHDRQHHRRLHQRDDVGGRGHLGHRPGRAHALDQRSEIGQQVRHQTRRNCGFTERRGDLIAP